MMRLIPAACLVAVTAAGCAARSPLAEVSQPLVRLDTADPGVLRHNGVWYTYSTSGCEEGGSYHIRRSEDLKHFEHAGFIFTPGNYPAWSGGCEFWAPEVHRVGNRFVAYFSIRDEEGRFCIGAATADSPAGPFADIGHPLVSDPHVGLIDASFFRDPGSGRQFLLWKEDGNAADRPTPIRMAPLSEDGLSVTGDPLTLITNDAPWEGDLVEAPNLVYRDGWYYLFFSGNAYYDERYGIGVARARDLTGPWEKYSGNPLRRSGERFSGPGHPFVMKARGEWLMFYHARDKATGEAWRFLMAEPLGWGPDGWPRPAGTE